MYTITGIESINNKKFRIYLNGQFAFILYKSELLHYRLEIDKELSEAEYRYLHDELVLKRAKLKALKLLTDMGRSEEGLKQKLTLAGFPDDIITSTMNYVKSFGYINDKEYARNLIYSKKDSKSKREIFALLIQKGVPEQTAREVMEEEYQEETELEMTRKLLRKKRYSEDLDEKQKEKIYAYLMRKGIPYPVIKEAISTLEV